MEVKNQHRISKEEILKNISELDIFSRYSEFKEIKKKFKSPFNNEKTPSCIVYSNLFFSCFSSGKKGNCFDLVMMKYGCTFSESLRIISNDFNIKADPNIDFTPIVFGITPKTYINKQTEIEIISKKFTIEGLNYWNQYLISEKTLNKYEIKQLHSYWINKRLFKLNKELGFAYDFYNYKYQLLFPDKPKEFKWISNTGTNDLQGFHQLPEEGDKLIITSSLKDVCCLYENYNLNCVAPKSETTIIPEIIIEYLKSRFKEIIVYLNNDLAGINSSKIYEEKYNLKWIVNPLTLSKDPSDVIKANQQQELTKFLKHENII
jgi:hypothetical protein